MEVPALDVRGLHRALDTVEWCLPSTFTETKVHHRYSRVTLVNAGHWWPAAEAFRFFLEPFAPIRECWLSRIAPGGFILPHRDAGPWFERWQVPIHAAGLFDDDRPEDGKAFRVSHWEPHSVWNDTDRDRVHLVIDRDVPLDLPPSPFALFPVPDKHAALVARAKES